MFRTFCPALGAVLVMGITTVANAQQSTKPSPSDSLAPGSSTSAPAATGEGRSARAGLDARQDFSQGRAVWRDVRQDERQNLRLHADARRLWKLAVQEERDAAKDERAGHVKEAEHDRQLAREHKQQALADWHQAAADARDIRQDKAQALKDDHEAEQDAKREARIDAQQEAARRAAAQRAAARTREHKS